MKKKTERKPSVLKAVVSLIFLIVAGWAIVNVAVDPFGVFGDKFMDRYDYDMTLNTRVGKVGWLSRHKGDYDSFIIGGRETSGFPVTALNDHLGGHFFDMGMPDADLSETERIAEYLLDNYTVNNLILCISPRDAAARTGEESFLTREHTLVDGSSAAGFYFSYVFANPVYAYNKYTSIMGGTAETVYSSETGQRTDGGGYEVSRGAISAKGVAAALESIARIAGAAEEKGVTLTIIGVPLTAEEYADYDPALLTEFAAGLPESCASAIYWDSVELAGDEKNFYENGDFNRTAGRKVLAEVFRID